MLAVHGPLITVFAMSPVRPLIVRLACRSSSVEMRSKMSHRAHLKAEGNLSSWVTIIDAGTALLSFTAALISLTESMAARRRKHGKPAAKEIGQATKAPRRMPPDPPTE